MGLFSDINGYKKESIQQPERKDKVDYSAVDFCGNDYQASVFEKATNNFNINADDFDSVFNTSADVFKDNYETLILDDENQGFNYEG